MKTELIQRLHKSFEDCAHQNDGVEFWLARELQTLLGYTEWRNFQAVINKARMACENAGQAVSDHFVEVNKMIDLAKGAQREVDDLALTRYACYLSSRGETEAEEANHTAWLKAKIETSLADSRPNIAHDAMMAKAHAFLESKKKNRAAH